MFRVGISTNTKAIIEKIIEHEEITEAKITVTDASEKGNNFMGALQRVTIEGIKDGKVVTEKIICKSIPPSQAIRDALAIVKYFRREIHAYNECIPAFKSLQNKFNIAEEDKFHFVECYKANPENLHEVILLEDLCNRGFEIFDRKKMLDMEHIGLVINDIARLHAISFVLKEDNPTVFGDLVKDLKKDYDVSEPVKQFIIASKDQVLDVLTDTQCYEKFHKYSENFFDKFFLSINPERTEPYNVICHGDCWVNNFLFKYKNKQPIEVRFVDWQLMKYNSPVVDLLHMIFTCLDEESRRQHYEEIFHTYYEVLRHQLKKFNCNVEKCYPEQIFRKHQKMMLPYGLTVAVMSLPLLLCQADEVIDMENLAQRGTYDERDYLKNTASINALRERMEGVIRDLIKLNFF